MTPYYTDEQVTLYHGDCLDVLAELPDRSVDAVVCDPPYGLEFMGKEWDAPWQESDINADAGFHGGGINATRKLPSFTGTTNPKCLRCKGTRRGRRDGTAKVAVCLCRDGGQFPNIRAVEMRAFQQWCQEWASECLRVLKPGGHLLAFGGSRTWHRLAAAIEDAGFEIRDSIAWLYGCLTDDVEVLTPTGWRRGIDVAVGDEVAQWNPVTGAITAAPVQRTYRAPWHGELVRFRNSDTDQLLTPNHRVWYRNNDHRGADGRAWREWSKYRVADAGSIGRRSPIRLPLAGEHNGPGVGGVDYAALLGWVWTEGGFDRSGSGVRIYQSSVNQQHCDTIAALLDRLTPHKRYDYQRTYKRRSGERHTYTASTWFLTGDVAERVRRDLPDKHPTYELLWRMTLDEKRAFIAAALDGDGSQSARGAWQFYQSDRADREWFATALAMVGWRGHVSDRPAPRTGGAVSVSQRADTTLTPKALRENAAEFYSGEVWCIGVPTGAFVARRHGLVFITGNSGFPKSLDVSKAIDKQRDDGADRQAVGAWLRSHREGRGLTQKAIATHWPSATGGLTGCVANWELGLNLPTWDQWLRLKELLSLPDDMDGEVWRLNGRKGEPGEAWRTAEVLGTEDRMNEPSGVVNVGQGARTPVTRLIKAANSEAARQWQGWGTALKPAFEPIVVARKPLAGTVAANVLEHGTGALNIDGCRVAIAPGDDIYAKHPHTVGGFGHAGAQVYGDSIGSHYTPKDGRWPTNVALDDAQAAELDAQTGVSVSRKGKPRAGANGNGWGMTATGAEYDDEGGASRFFPVFRYEAKAPGAERPSVVTTKLRLRADLTPEQVDHVVARLREAGVEID
ncbi:DNA methyltransferase [Mycobacterium phage DRBy19]|uniref:Helix-turn-helix DNA-binding domain protein n=1 Tax=Mycobacterium phage DRBy19 TaxID=2725612 RepID=A0A6M3T4X9_9CAUD|nr:DNA methyltransferase [Mycobacterium phage DRBy19]QJD53189.1 helix-turn-helix DNA-binding domain protein [Mycobacterium phage DRBy19]